MARLLEESIISEDAETLTIRFTRRNGKYLDRTVPKIDGVSNEELLLRWHRRTTIDYLQNRILLNKWITPQQNSE